MRFICCSLFFALVGVPLFKLHAEQDLPTYRESISRLDPMSLSGVEPRLANVLRNYYEYTFKDAYTWDQIESIRFDGILDTEQGAFRFVAFKKKPDYLKVVVFLPNGGRYVSAYDGQEVWQLAMVDPDAQPESMSKADALNFIRDATTGGHLLYPSIEGKQIEFLGISELDGSDYYELMVTLPDGQEVRSYLNMITFSEVQQVTLNNSSGSKELNIYSDFREIDDVQFPYVTTLFVDGIRIHQSHLTQVQTNVGVMPWMFSRPSGAYIPGTRYPNRTLGSSGVSILELSDEDAELSGESLFDVDRELLDPELVEILLDQVIDPELGSLKVFAD